MKNIYLLFVLCFLVVSCSEKPERPPRDILKSVTFENTSAERVNITTLSWAYSAFDRIKEAGRKSFYLQDKDMSVVEIINDSTLQISNKKKLNSSTARQIKDAYALGLRCYIFHKNGDIEMKAGEMVRGFSCHSTDAEYYIMLYIDGATGVILKYFKHDFATSNEYYVSNSGEVIIGNDYGYLDGGVKARVATKTFDIMVEDIRKCL